MLQQNQISNLLKSALQSPTSSTTPNFHPISISLLSNHGNPLISLTTKQFPKQQEQVQAKQVVSDRQWQPQPPSQLHSSHSSNAGTPTTTTSAAAALGGGGAPGDEHGQGHSTKKGAPASLSTDSQSGGVSTIALDQLKIYSLVAYNSCFQSPAATTDAGGLSSDVNNWSIVDFGNVRCIISKIDLSNQFESNNHNGGSQHRNDNGQDIKRGDNQISATDYNDADNDDDEVESYQEHSFRGYFVVLFYQAKQSSVKQSTDSSSEVEAEADAVAKIKIDAVTNALREGLTGYREPQLTY
ncbi:hypothetical protein KGF57_000879 [Candida theae]|uniref:Uncharacterized protein n=1 Tax=Candida theae TaxID=1198502 RepID=A0AAD5G0G9_9ASCO|nr:uncharacterized protein KGF57_000879 [Candida theae]KAI5965086.1 hypothetical protein KGF57_000879 [Candida theae]